MEITYIDLIAFKNGVFDFQEKRFRKIRPDDNCDITIGASASAGVRSDMIIKNLWRILMK